LSIAIEIFVVLVVLEIGIISLTLTLYRVIILIMGTKRNDINWDEESIRRLREKLELTQAELAEELGTRQQTISEWETGMYRPRGTSAKLLSIVAERAKFKYSAK
jgi:DNA-binding XRE family transcriptional regulator